MDGRLAVLTRDIGEAKSLVMNTACDSFSVLTFQSISGYSRSQETPKVNRPSKY